MHIKKREKKVVGALGIELSISKQLALAATLTF